jgi:hypothetical protein
MTGKPSLAPVPNNTLGRPRHPLRMPGYLQDRISLAILGMVLAIVALIVALGFMTFAFVAAKYQDLPPIQGAIQLPDGTILNQELLHDGDAVEAAFKAAVRDHVYRWRSVTDGLTVEQQWKGMEFRLGGDAYAKLFGEMSRDPSKKPGMVLAQGMMRCTDVPPEMTATPSAGKPGYYEVRWYEKTMRAGAPCDEITRRVAANLRWAEFRVEIDPKPSVQKKKWNLMGITITEYKSDVVD